MRPAISTAHGYPILLIFLVMGCGSGSRIETDPARSVEGECVLTPGSPDRLDPITIVLTEPVDPARAPIPTTEAERLVFRHFICQGKIQRRRLLKIGTPFEALEFLRSEMIEPMEAHETSEWLKLNGESFLASHQRNATRVDFNNKEQSHLVPLELVDA